MSNLYTPVAGDGVKFTRNLVRSFHLGRPDIGQIEAGEVATVIDVTTYGDDDHFRYVDLHSETRGNFKVEVGPLDPTSSIEVDWIAKL